MTSGYLLKAPRIYLGHVVSVYRQYCIVIVCCKEGGQRTEQPGPDF